MTRSQSEPYYDLLSRDGWHDIRQAYKYGHHRHDGHLDPEFYLDVIDHTWFGIKFKAKKIRLVKWLIIIAGMIALIVVLNYFITNMPDWAITILDRNKK